MTDKQQKTVFGIMYLMATLLIIMGAILRIQHNPHAPSFLLSGFMLGSVASTLETIRLKKKIRHLEEQLGQRK